MTSKIGGSVGGGNWKYAHGTAHYGRNFSVKWLKVRSFQVKNYFLRTVLLELSMLVTIFFDHWLATMSYIPCSWDNLDNMNVHGNVNVIQLSFSSSLFLFLFLKLLRIQILFYQFFFSKFCAVLQMSIVMISLLKNFWCLTMWLVFIRQ